MFLQILFSISRLQVCVNFYWSILSSNKYKCLELEKCMEYDVLHISINGSFRLREGWLRGKDLYPPVASTGLPQVACTWDVALPGGFTVLERELISGASSTETLPTILNTRKGKVLQHVHIKEELESVVSISLGRKVGSRGTAVARGIASQQVDRSIQHLGHNS